ncbi:MAG: SpoIIE family protein phosphatase [Erysipelotrichaceae bacterium]|nr:SpoIIE family protein phosphatase [Erysipelotrichaceae bacterium]
MKKYDLTFHKILKCILCVMMLIFVLQYRSVYSEDGSSYEAGGKHNGPVSVDPLGGEDGYSAVLYNNTNGLPTSEANDIVQTQEGFIWIGSYAGLIRYDGSRFERQDSTAGITSVKCLYVDSLNRLWVGTNDSGVVLIHNDATYHWGLHDGMKSVSVRSMLEGEDGKIYVATTEGLLSIDQNFKMSYVEDLRVVDAFIHELRMGVDGRIYGVTNSGDIVVLKNGKVDEYHRLSQSSFGGINCILPDPHDPSKIYVETQDGRVYHDTLKGGFENSTPIDISPLDQVQSMEYLGGKIWFTTRNGIGVLDEEGFHVLKNIPMKNSIGHVMSDYEGNLWFTSTREGVMKIVKNRFSDLFERYELSDRVVNSTCMYDGDLFIATDTGLIVIDENGPLEKVKLNESIQIYGEERKTDDLLELLDNCRIRSIIRDSKDRLWISTWRKYGLLCYDHGDLRSFRKEEGLASDAIRMVDECIDGRILVAGNGGVSIIKDDRVVATYTEKDGITNTDVLCVVEGEGDDIIVGSDGAGIFILSKNGMKHFDHNNGLSSDAVMRIKFDERNDVYWIVTGNSLSYLSRDYELHKADLFPYSNNFDIYFNSKGELWVLSSNGIYIAKAEDILSGEEINTVHYSMSDGLPCIATANSYSELTDDGDLYIAGTTGVAKVNIEDPFEEMKDLKFAIPYLEADGKKIYPDKDGVFFVTYNTRKLTIYGYVYTYSLTEPLISYRLDGFDEENTTGTAAEVFPVYYTNLRGGTYHFIVELQQSLTGESVGTVIRIEKELALYESVWFYLYSFLSALLVLYALIGLYIDGREKKLERKHKEESEKQQIANEMKMGNDIQQSTLPHVFPPFPDRTEFELFASMDPAREVGGDFYDFFFIDDDHLCLIMADVSGKGIPGALFMMVSKAILNNSAMIYDSPAKILTKANEAICANNRAKMFVTVWLGILEVSTGKLKAANAGHEYPIIRKPQGGFEIFKDKHDFVIGGLDNFVYHEYEMDLEPGSKIFLYTDGIPEATDSKERLFGMENLLKALNEDPDAGPEQLTINVRKAVDGFVKEAEQFDDLTMMCLEYKGKE